MKVNEDVTPNVWELETINDTNVTLNINREISSNEEAPAPVYLEMTVSQVQNIKGEEIVVTIPVKINCSEADVLARRMGSILPNYTLWFDESND